MSLADFLQGLRRNGITLELQGDNLKIQAPEGALTASIRNQFITHKKAIIDWLKESATDDGAPLPLTEPAPEKLHEPFPLSDLQLGFYMADDPYMEFHVRPHYYIEKNLPGLDVARYEAAWNRALRRHRKELVTVRPDGLLETLTDPALLAITVNDWRDASPATVEEGLARVRAGMMRSELPLDRWPWVDLRVSLWREEGQDRVRIHYNHNNFFSDGYGTTRLLEEVDRYYKEPGLELPPIELSFRDAAVALDRLAESELGRTAQRYWESRLADLPGPPALPLRAGMERRCRSHLQRRETFIDARIWQRFKVRAQQAGLTPSNAIFAAYVEVLAAWSNSRHFVVSNMMTRRLNIHPQIRDIIGNFASLYPLEINLRDRASFRDSARRIQEQVIRDAGHLHWGGMKVMQTLNRQQGGFGRAPIPFVIGSGLFMEGFERSDLSCLETSQVMLDHQFWELSDGRLYYVWDLLEEFFPERMIDDMGAAYANLIAHLADVEGAWDADRFDLIPGWHLAERALPPVGAEAVPAVSLRDFIREATEAHPDAIAVKTSQAALTYRQLYDGSHAVAQGLIAAGLRPGQRVAVVADRSPALLQAVHGTLLAGGVYVPVDPSLPEERIHYLLKNCGASQVLVQNRHSAACIWPVEMAPQIIEDLIETALDGNILPETAPGDLAYLIYTSGSTGLPKGVMIDHRGAVNTVLDINERYKVGPEDRLFGVSSFGFDLSVYDIFGAASSGATLVYPEPEQAFNPAQWLDTLLAEHVTVWNSAPPLATLLVEAAETRGCVLPDLRLVMLSGDWIPVDLPDRIRRVAPSSHVVSLGGATEASIWSIIYDIDRVDPAWPSIPYGYPMKNQSWHILDDWGRPAPLWVAGDLYIGGIGLAQGYWGDAGKTAAAFITHPRTGERIYRTGDIGRYLPGGLIEFLGRKDSQVKFHGHRIELGEIEKVLGTHPEVSAALVVMRQPAPDRAAYLAAHVVRRNGSEIGADTLRQHLAKKLPDYMVPRVIHFLPQLPITANGKIDRKALPQIEEAMAPALVREHCAPSDLTEARLLRMWQKVLKTDAIGVTDNFFELGGQSFEAVHFVGLIRETLGVTLSLGDIWQHPTIRELAERLRNEQPAARNPIVRINAADTRTSDATPLFLVHPAGGQVMCYRHLGRLLERPVYAFEALGVDGGTTAGGSVPDLALAYLAALHSVCPDGPVLLGGWSSGGPIAFELAAQLRQYQRTIEGVIVIDSPAPLVHGEVSDDILFHWFLEDLNLDTRAKEAIRALAPTGSDRERLTLADQVVREYGSQLSADIDHLADIYRVFKGIVRATRSYRPDRIDVDMLVIRAHEGVVSEFASHPFDDEIGWGWQGFTTGRVEGEFVSGTHHTLLATPAVTRCASIMRGWLAQRTDRLSITAERGFKRGLLPETALGDFTPEPLRGAKSH
jgi:pyochelin synthetase